MKFLVLFVAVLMYGCAARPSPANPDATLKVGLEDVSVSVSNIKPKNDEAVARYPDESGLQTIFIEEINRALSDLEENKGAPVKGNIARFAVDVVYKRHFAHVSAGVTMPQGSFSVQAFDQTGARVWQHGLDDIVIHGRVWRSIIDNYKVPFGLFREEEERKYLRVWASVIAKAIYSRAKAHPGQTENASSKPVSP